MAITVNGEEHPFREGLTVAALLREKKFSFPLITVFVNKRRIPRKEHASTEIGDGDEVSVMHLMSGG